MSLKSSYFSFILLGFIAFQVPLSTSQAQTSHDIVFQMLKAIDEVKTVKYTLNITERIGGALRSTSSQVKLQRFPRKLYFISKGREILWVQGENNGNALVNPHSFPYINLNLDPNGSVMRKNQHHTIFEMGFDYFGDIIRDFTKKNSDKFNQYFIYTGQEVWSQRVCDKVIMTYPPFAFIPYTVKKGETIISIAQRLKLSEYMILENNPGLSGYEDVTEGQQIKIPNIYAKMVILYIDHQNHLPINCLIYDDKGLFESYSYSNLLVNPVIKDEEFKKDYKDYGF